ncbi:MAG TPA: hypothetical protein VFB58_01120 [Chloroflexota bacterium]|nr:hypothetical protein [Chloroflexota bacterium]
MINVVCTIRDYNAADDTCTVEIQGVGIIDLWVDGVAVAPTVSRGYLVYGASGVLSLPDQHRLCEASLIQVVPPTNLQTLQGGSVQRTLTGRTLITTDGTGNGSATVTFSSAFTTAPTVSLLGDNLAGLTVSTVSTTGFTAALTKPGLVHAYVWFSWSATGT